VDKHPQRRVLIVREAVVEAFNNRDDNIEAESYLKSALSPSKGKVDFRNNKDKTAGPKKGTYHELYTWVAIVSDDTGNFHGLDTFYRDKIRQDRNDPTFNFAAADYVT